jgi:Acetyltransferase (GNAT) domain
VSSEPRADLIADRGEVALSDDFFRSRPFYDAEEVTHTLLLAWDSGEARVPLLVREVPGSERVDAVSPYGYPGGVVQGGTPARPTDVDWSGTGLITVFARERLAGEPWLDGARERSCVLLHDPARERRLRPRLAEQIRSNERRGWSVDRAPGPNASPDQLGSFESAYEQTMRRTEAAERYFFSRDYFSSVLSFGDSWLLLALSEAGEIGAGAIVVRSDRMLHYFLGGTAEEHLAESPFKNVVEAMMTLADELGLPLNLGGGVRPGDGLEAFKRGFANTELPFRTHEIVCDDGEYERLSEGRRQGGFFPAYRADGG